MLALLLSSTLASAACPVDSSSLRALLDTALDAHEDHAWEEFPEATEQVRAGVRCLTDVLDPSSVVRLHDLESRVALQDRSFDAVTRAFQGVLAIEPGFVFDGRYGSDHPYRRAFDAARLAADPVQPLPRGQWVVDGRLYRRKVPTARNTLVQQVDEDGGVSATWYLRGEGLPDALLPDPDRGTGPVAGEQDSNRGLRRGAVAVGVTGVALFTAGAVLGGVSSHQGDALSEEAWNTRRVLNYTGVFGGLALGTAGGVMAVVAW